MLHDHKIVYIAGENPNVHGRVHCRCQLVLPAVHAHTVRFGGCLFTMLSSIREQAVTREQKQPGID